MKIKLTESKLNKIIAESVKKVLKEYHVINSAMGIQSGAGDFERALVDAWKLAGNANKRKLEQAFPDYFPSEAMYGNEQDSFDFRDFPNYEVYNDYYKGWKERNGKL